jgi:hypothetical protein
MLIAMRVVAAFQPLTRRGINKRIKELSLSNNNLRNLAINDFAIVRHSKTP